MNPNRLNVLVKGELIRLHKYNVFSISILVAFIWGVVLFFMEENVLANVLPFILVIDATMMPIMYIGAVTHFEKTESTISTLLVTPIQNAELVLSKIIAFTLHNIFSAALLVTVFVILKDVQVNYVLIAAGVILATLFFTILGLCLSYYQKDFTTMLVNIMIYAFAFMIPTALYEFGLLTADFWEYFLLINPVQNASELIAGGFKGYEYELAYYVALGYTIIGGLLLYTLIAIPKFQNYAIKQSGV